MTGIKNAEIAAEMLEALRMTNSFSCKAKVCLANEADQVYWVCFDVVDELTGEEMDDLSYEAWMHRIEDAIDNANALSRFELDRVSALAVEFKCRPIPVSVYQVECSDLNYPYWNKVSLKKTEDESSALLIGAIEPEDQRKIITLDQVKDLMVGYYQEGRLKQAW